MDIALEETVDLWPKDLFEFRINTPLAIMKEQASLLTKKSNHRLRAEVETRATGGDKFRHIFYLIVPALEDYRYELFEIEHGVLPYPLTIISQPGIAIIFGSKPIVKGFGSDPINSETEFVDWLKGVLQSTATKKIIGSLFAQFGT